jgi:CheY-like chemotaxis protein
MTGLDLLRTLREDRGRVRLPVIIHTARILTRREEAELRRMAETIVPKAPRSLERVFDETALFLGRPDSPAPHAEGNGLPPRAEAHLQGRKILLVDDDARNIFALKSVLESQGMTVLPAADGWEALGVLQAHPDTALVLLDVMLPGLDGLATAKAIRQNPSFQTLPIIALTAKAMKGDRELCLESGASAYLPKPVDLGQLLAAMQKHLP